MENRKKYLVYSFYGKTNKTILAEFDDYDNALRFIESLDKERVRKNIFYRIKEKNENRQL